MTLFHPIQPQFQILEFERALNLILILPGLVQLQNTAFILRAYLLLIYEQNISLQEVFIEQHAIDFGFDTGSPHHRFVNIERLHHIIEQTRCQIRINLFDLDFVINKQRRLFHRQITQLLSKSEINFLSKTFDFEGIEIIVDGKISFVGSDDDIISVLHFAKQFECRLLKFGQRKLLPLFVVSSTVVQEARQRFAVISYHEVDSFLYLYFKPFRDHRISIVFVCDVLAGIQLLTFENFILIMRFQNYIVGHLHNFN